MFIYAPSSSLSGTITVTNGGVFTFTSAQMKDGASSSCVVCATFNIQGFLGATSLFSFNGTTTAAYQTFSNPNPSAVIDRLAITMNRGFVSYNLDSVVVDAASAVPEPSSAALLVAGGIALTLRKRTIRRNKIKA